MKDTALRLTKIDSRIYEQFNQRAPFKLEDATILIFAQVGSHSHNTYIPKDDPQAVDDTDYMGVIVPPIDYTLGMKSWDNLDFIHEELDCVFYSFRKFVNLLAKGNPNVLGLLFLNVENIKVEHYIWNDIIRMNRQVFLNKKLTANSFVGYGREQLKKMTHFNKGVSDQWDESLEVITAAGWTVEQITRGQHRDMPNREAVAEKLVARGLIVTENDVTYHLDIAPELIKRIHARHFQGYMGQKRKDLVRKYGYDTKNAAHLIRLMRMCCEYMITGELQVYRTTDAQEIKDIKSGKWTLDQVKVEAEKLFKSADILYEVSTLPELPDMEGINQVCKQALLAAYKLSHESEYVG